MDSFPEFREGNGRPSAKGPLSRDPGNTSRDCPLFCVFDRTEVNEKTTRPRTYSPGNDFFDGLLSAKALQNYILGGFEEVSSSWASHSSRG
jgi:hypothetical protein